MLKNRSFLVKIVKDDVAETPTSSESHNPPETRILEVARESAKIFVVLYAMSTAINTTSKILVSAAEAKIK